MYRIGELAKVSGVSTDTLRYYEKESLVEPAARSSAGYRLYESEAVNQIRFIQQAKAVGFTLDGIRELLSLKVDNDAHSCQEVKDLTEAKLVDVQNKIAELEHIRMALEKLNAACCGGPESAAHCSILQMLESGAPKRIKG